MIMVLAVPRSMAISCVKKENNPMFCQKININV